MPAPYFDRYITVDWSANSKPKGGKDSIWVCTHAADGESSTANPRTRREAETVVREQLLRAVRMRQRVLVGFDFPYGYPAGFADALGFTGAPGMYNDDTPGAITGTVNLALAAPAPTPEPGTLVLMGLGFHSLQ